LPVALAPGAIFVYGAYPVGISHRGPRVRSFSTAFEGSSVSSRQSSIFKLSSKATGRDRDQRVALCRTDLSPANFDHDGQVQEALPSFPFLSERGAIFTSEFGERYGVRCEGVRRTHRNLGVLPRGSYNGFPYSLLGYIPLFVSSAFPTFRIFSFCP